MTTFNTTQCHTENWSKREMTQAEMDTVRQMVNGFSNVTVTGVRVSDKAFEVWYAVNYLSQAKYPNNHREYQATRSTEPVEWQGWR